MQRPNMKTSAEVPMGSRTRSGSLGFFTVRNENEPNFKFGMSLFHEHAQKFFIDACTPRRGRPKKKHVIHT